MCFGDDSTIHLLNAICRFDGDDAPAIGYLCPLESMRLRSFPMSGKKKKLWCECMAHESYTIEWCWFCSVSYALVRVDRHRPYAELSADITQKLQVLGGR